VRIRRQLINAHRVREILLEPGDGPRDLLAWRTSATR
jgi:hypothetical protein